MNGIKKAATEGGDMGWCGHSILWHCPQANNKDLRD